VRAKAAVPLRTRNRLHRSKEESTGPDAKCRDGPRAQLGVHVGDNSARITLGGLRVWQGVRLD